MTEHWKGNDLGQGARFLYLCPLGMSIYLVLTNQWEPQLLRYPLHVSKTSKAGGQALSAPHTEGAHPKEAPRFNHLSVLFPGCSSS